MMIVNPYVYAGLPANEVLHLDFDGANGSTTFTDSTGRHVPTAAGTAAISTDRSYDGATSLKLATGKNYVRCNGGVSSTDFSFPGDFSIRCQAYLNSTASLIVLWFAGASSDSSGFDSTAKTFMLSIAAGGTVQLRSGLATGGVIITGSVIAAGAWHDIMITRTGSLISMIVNGSTVGTYSNSATWGNGEIFIGGNNASINFNGYVDKFVVTKN